MGTMVVWLLLSTVQLIVCHDECSMRVHQVVSDDLLQQLFQLVSQFQTLAEPPSLHGQSLVKAIGSYRSVVKLHRAGSVLETAQRWAINVNDLNSFVPMWVSMVLLEAHKLGGAPQLSDYQLLATVDFCRQFQNPNTPGNSSLMAFWPYFFNPDYGHYFPLPVSYKYLYTLAGLPTLNNGVKMADGNQRPEIGLRHLAETLNKLVVVISGQEGFGDMFVRLLQQMENLDKSPDADDTFVWLGLGSLLTGTGDSFPLARRRWLEFNPNLWSDFSALKKYAYRPFSQDGLVNTIDPTSYYVIRDFIDASKRTGRDVALVTTWFTNGAERIETDRGQLKHKVINDIDASVCANVVYGITGGVLSGLVEAAVLEDPEVAMIYLNTSRLLSFLVASNFSGRPDLALPYYPSRYQFYWTVARVLALMENHQTSHDLPRSMSQVYEVLKIVLQVEVTDFLITSAKREEEGFVYFDDFLGNGDFTDKGEPIIRGEDRIFTTALAANILMDIWSTRRPYGLSSIEWRAETPANVIRTVDGCVQWLVQHTLSGQFKPWNVFFSTQNKGRHDLPFRYPANLFLERPQPYSFLYATTLELMVGVRGHIPNTQYQHLLDSDPFGQPTPRDFLGFNHPDFSDFVFWNSEPYTYAVALLALSKYRNMSESRDNTCDSD